MTTSTAARAAAATFAAGADADTLRLTSDAQTAADSTFANFTGLETLETANGANVITLGTNAEAAGLGTVIGGTGADVVNASALTSSLDASITGGTGADTLTGGAGADTFVGGAGADVITGGAGVDVYDINAITESALIGINSIAAKLATGLTGMDIMTVAAGDKVDLAGIIGNATVALDTLVTDTNLTSTVGAAKIERQVVAYDATAGTVTSVAADATTANACLIMLDSDIANSGTTADFSFLLVGVTDVTSYASGVITV